MVRKLRHNVAGGGNHITTRGMGRRKFFLEDRDRKLKSALRRVSDEIRREENMKYLDVPI